MFSDADSYPDDSLDSPLQTWPDPIIEAFATAPPASGLFQEFLRMALRTSWTAPTPFFQAADIPGTLEDLGVDYRQLAEELGLPIALSYALASGWHRPGIRGLALIAEAVGVPVSRFFFEDDSPRIQVRRYRAYKIEAARATMFGNDGPLR